MPRTTYSPGPLIEGEAAAADLADALERAGFTLPSLQGDYPVAGRPLVQLGGASAVLVRALASWIRERV